MSQIKSRVKNNYDINQSQYYVEIPPFPKEMLLEVCNICNHSCIFCANSKSSRNLGYIEPDTAKSILREAYELGTSDVGFYSTGEPLLNRRLPEYVRYAKSLGYSYVYIDTNGALLTQEIIAELAESGIDSVKISLNAGTAKSYRFIHGKDDFDLVLLNIKNLHAYKKVHKKSFNIYVGFISTKYTKKEMILLKKLVSAYVDDFITYECRNQAGVMYEINELLSESGSEVKMHGSSSICPYPFRKLHITKEGYMTVCCADFQNYLAISDLKEESLEEAWKSSAFIKIRKMHLNAGGGVEILFMQQLYE